MVDRAKMSDDPRAQVVYRDDAGVHVRGRVYTLGEIARGSSMARTHITRIFNGKRGLSLESAQKICGFLGIPIESLLKFVTSLKPGA